MSRPLSDRVLIITGASSGIGAATARVAARRGMRLVLNARRADRLDALATELRTLGTDVTVVAGDVNAPDLSDRMLDAADDLGGTDAVFANAGYGYEAAFHESDFEDLRRIFETNFFAAADLLHRAAGRLVDAARPGHLLMCSSCLAKFTTPRYGPYCATKAAQSHLCMAMRSELADHDIAVSSVHPIGTITEFGDVVRRLGGRSTDDRSGVERTPRLFKQPASRVADAVVDCLRRPRPEVWTSLSVRLLATAMTLSPGFHALVGRTQLKRIRSRENS